jgi:two-component system, NtrC family, response regulator PilR
MSSQPNIRILVVDDERSLCEYLAILLRREGFQPTTAMSVEDALDALSRSEFDLILSDLMIGNRSGLEILTALQVRPKRPKIIFMTAYGTIETAVGAIRQGASDFILKPFANDVLARSLRQALEASPPAMDKRDRTHEPKPDSGSRLETRLVGSSTKASTLRHMIERIAWTESTVLITGESGTGKEVAARAIHMLSPRAAGPFLPVHCAALSEGLLESELFGHVKGSFTGAATDKTGLLLAATGGTLFLDEIGEIPLSTQIKLLRILQDRNVTPVGGIHSTPVDVRIVAATNANLEAMIQSGRFREDLYYRLNVIRLQTPSLRERLEDLPDLSRSLLARISQRLNRPTPGIDPSAITRLNQHSWPGNIRELENVLERALVLGSGDGSIKAEDILLDPPTPHHSQPVLPDSLANMERAYISWVIQQSKGNRTVAAQRLGLSTSMLDAKLIQPEFEGS